THLYAMTDGKYNYSHFRTTKYLEFLDSWREDKLPDDDIAVPLKHQPSVSEDGILLLEHQQGAKKWKELALDFFKNETPSVQMKSHGGGSAQQIN
ncbi:11432_t:CDS:2, partial [Paraglomus brasilianum]